MDELEKKKLAERNDKIIEYVMREIETKCKDSVDLIGIGGSFCNGDIYENSDLDLVIIVNDDSARVLNKCFIIGDVGFDIYTQTWSAFEEMAKYHNPYVTKLIDLKIVYKNGDEVMERYMTLQKKLNENMQNNALVMLSIREHFKNVLNAYRQVVEAKDISIAYRNLATMITGVEYILYMANKSYVTKGVKRIPEEIGKMEILPEGFMDKYLDITNSTTLEEIREKASAFMDCIEEFLNEHREDYAEPEEEEEPTVKKEISVDDLTGTYEEIYSNWRNKAHHAAQINSVYLSFMVMAACQRFYDEMYEKYDIPEIDLIGMYNPNDLEGNAYQFDKALNEWGKLYDKFNKKIEKVDSVEELMEK